MPSLPTSWPHGVTACLRQALNGDQADAPLRLQCIIRVDRTCQEVVKQLLRGSTVLSSPLWNQVNSQIQSLEVAFCLSRQRGGFFFRQRGNDGPLWLQIGNSASAPPDFISGSS